MRGMVASSFTAYISHTCTDCQWKRGEPMRGRALEFGGGGGVLCVKCMHIYQNVLVREKERGGVCSEN